MGNRCYALMKWGQIYTLQPYRDPWGRKSPFKYMGYAEGHRVGLFKTKKHFEEFVSRQPRPYRLGPHAEAAFRAEAISTLEGSLALQKLADQAEERRRRQSPPVTRTF